MTSLAGVGERPELVYQSIYDALCDGRLRAGDALSEEALAARFDAPPALLTEAVRRLERDGFLRRDKDHGLRVAPLDPDYVRSLFDLRGALEGLAAREAALRVGPAAAAQGVAIIEAGRAAIASGSAARMVAADFAFHGLLFQLSGNMIVTQTAALYWPQIRWLLGNMMVLRSRWEAAWQEHEEILRAIVDGSGETAEWLARAHVRGSVDHFISYLGAVADTTRVCH